MPDDNVTDLYPPVSGVEVSDEALEQIRLDSYFSLKTGLGGTKDKSVGIDFCHDRRFVDAQTVNDLYAGDAIAGRIVDEVVNSALRKGWTIKFSTVDDDGATIDLDPKEAAQLHTQIQEWEKHVDLKGWAEKWWKRGRAQGGSLAVFGVEDGVEDTLEPLRPGGEFDWIRVFTRHEVSADDIGVDPKDPLTFSLPIAYRLHPRTVNDSLSQGFVHASRTHRYEGVQVDDPLISTTSIGSGDSFGDSVFERTWIPLKNWNSAMQGAGHIIQDFSQAVYSVNMLRQLLRAKGGRTLMLKQFQVMEEFRSMFNATVVDAKDNYERKTTSTAGLPEIMDRFAQHLSAASGMALTRLIGVSPGGFGTGDSESDDWDSTVEGEQDAHLRPFLERVYSILFETKAFKGKIPGGWTIVFTPLKQKSELDQATIQKTQTETDLMSIEAGILTQEEIAMSRYGKGEFSLHTELDMKTRIAFAEGSGEPGDGGEDDDLTAPQGSTGGSAEEDVAKTAMNGAQVASLVEIVTLVAASELPRDSAIAIIQAAYQLSEEEATAIVGDSGEGFDPNAPPAPEPLAPGAPPNANPKTEPSNPAEGDGGKNGPEAGGEKVPETE